jgi:hypothetical protein
VTHFGYGAASRAEIWAAVLAARKRSPTCTIMDIASAQRKVEELRELSWFYGASRVGGAG